MVIRSFFAKGLVAAALLGLLWSPLVRVAMQMPATATASEQNGLMADMPCCPDEAPAKGDCAKTCPLMAMCVTQFLHAPLAIVTPVSLSFASRLVPLNDRPLSGLDTLPGRKPPKSEV